MIFKKFEVNPFSQNSYLVHNQKKAILIDAGFYSKEEQDYLRNYLNNESLELIAVLLTHAHIDHVLGLNELVKDFKIPVYLHPEDVILLRQVHQQGQLFGFKVDPISIQTIDLLEQTEFKLDEFVIDVLFTPGHAPGHLSFYFKNDATVVSGDVLFAGSIGRTDLYKGDFNLLSQSIQQKLYTLPLETKVLSGHGQQTTIKREKTTNPYVRGV